MPFDSQNLPVLAAILIVLVTIIGFVVWRRSKSAAPKVTPETAPEKSEEIPAAVEAPRSAVNLLDTRLGKTRSGLGRKLADWFSGAPVAKTVSEWEQLEEVLLEGDVGVHTAQALVGRVKARCAGPETLPLPQCFREETEKLLEGLPHGLLALDGSKKPYVISVVGINGVGKTTTIGKLAQHFKSRGLSVLLGAGDTFRAGAIAQLKTWADRVGTEFVTGREGADPGAVAFDSVSAGQSRGVDVVLLDTAGRLHTKSNLMDELKKIHRVIKKVIPEAPHETWLVIDGTLGQNSLTQAKEFQKALELTGIIVTKLDGTAKGGAVLAIASELRLPIRFIGIGEAVEDLVPFEPKPFVQALLGQ